MNETIRKMPQVRVEMECKHKCHSRQKRISMPLVLLRHYAKKAIKTIYGFGIAASAIMLLGIAGGMDLGMTTIGQAITNSAVWVGVLAICLWRLTK